MKEMAEWETNPGTDGLFEAFTQTGKERATEEWMEEGRRILEKGEGTQEAKEEENKTDEKKQGFIFLFFIFYFIHTAWKPKA